ncbi:hypothetical protein GOP47_0013679 [Adiantum capillus-veneris]|uniref:Alcohol dehydrogenase-like C-terminal domain-containing protein n=1 Tax=Adiantum capillus-veneris TaxID=13818 RepID=A0A9D4UNZ6_ADICA|nr:hypothetical protein GOP47_0013679 [Adiantum capillus-veneris]
MASWLTWPSPLMATITFSKHKLPLYSAEVIQLAKYKGFKTINLVRRDDVKEELKALGADEVINTTTEDVVMRVKEITGGKLAYGSIDSIAGPLSKIVAACTRDNGDVFMFGALESDAIISLKDLYRKVKVRMWVVSMKLSEEKSQLDMEEIIELQAKGIIKPLVGKSFPLIEYKEAIQESERPKRGGKVLLVG